MLEVGIVAVDDDLGDDGDHIAADAFAPEQLGRDALDHVSHAALRIRNTGVERERRDAALAFLGADQNVADLRPIAVRDNNLAVGMENREQMLQRFARVLELLRDRAALSRPRDGVAA